HCSSSARSRPAADPLLLFAWVIGLSCCMWAVSLSINTNGFVAMAQPSAESTYLGKMPAGFGMIAALHGDLDTGDGVGKVYYRQDASPATLRQAAEQINRAFPEDDEVREREMEHLFYFNQDIVQLAIRDGLEKQRNSFQLVIASAETTSYAILLYPRKGMQFASTAVGGSSQAMQAGFSKGLVKYLVFSTRQGPYYRITTERETSVRALAEETNSGKRGVWVYEIGTSPYFTSVAPGEVTDLPPDTGLESRVSEEATSKRYPGGGQQVTYSPYEPEEEVYRKEQPHQGPHHGGQFTVHTVQYQPQVVVVDDGDINVLLMFDVLTLMSSSRFTVFSYNSETCANNRNKCSTFADCKDYASGYCCHCRPGYYGNGIQCVSEGKPQRMNGKVNGRVYVGNSPSPVEFNSNDLHSYVVANDGRAYVAISTIPARLGPSLQPLSALGAVIGWAFALEQPGYKNGFSIIGGEFTCQAEVTFLPAQEKLTIKQVFSGIDEHDHLVVSTTLEGRVPEVLRGSTVQIEPYSEIYQYSSNLITSSSTRDYTVSLDDGSAETRTYQWRQTITFQSCPNDEAARAVLPTQMLSVDQVFVMYDSNNELIRYAMSNKIGDVNGVDRPVDHCAAGSHDCDITERAHCSYSGGSSYICSCLPGFQGHGRVCQDIDECQSARCHQNAVCYNTQGSFTCQCRPGYYGDGFYCSSGTSLWNGRPSWLSRTKSQCETHRDRLLGSTEYGPQPVPGQYVPTCDSQGAYEASQCHGSIGHCWCVDRNGLEIPGTRTGPGRGRPLCIEQGPTVRPAVGPTPRPDVYPLPPGTHLLFAQSGRIEFVPLEGYNMKKTEARTVLHLPKVIIGVAYDCVEKMVYWTDITSPSISKANLQGGGAIPVIRSDLESPEGIAIDHLGRTLFWTDSMKDRIEVASLDGTKRRVLIDTNLVNPRAIIVDPVNGNMYWADWNRDAPKIETSAMDGTNRRVLVKDDLGLPNGLTYDPQSSQLCWADAGTHMIECMNPVQGDRRKAMGAIQYPFGITSHGKNIYYTDWRRDAVIMVDRQAGTETDVFLPQKQTRLYGITTAYAQCPSGTHRHTHTHTHTHTQTHTHTHTHIHTHTHTHAHLGEVTLVRFNYQGHRWYEGIQEMF
uniref:Nidogen 1a n=1 Tax=Oncorhynchus tshawytscha TaxID=74940 RepID=A0AAZ3S0B1_ONCTS